MSNENEYVHGYVNSRRLLGVPDDQIAKELSYVGWARSDVEEILDRSRPSNSSTVSPHLKLVLGVVASAVIIASVVYTMDLRQLIGGTKNMGKEKVEDWPPPCEGRTWRAFTSDLYRYSFCHPSDMEGGVRDPDSMAPVLELVFFNSAADSNNRLGISVSVEKWSGETLSDIAANLEAGSKMGEAELTTLDSRTVEQNGARFLEKTYTSDAPGLTHYTVRIASVGGEIYVFGVLRSDDQPETIKRQEMVFRSIAFR